MARLSVVQPRLGSALLWLLLAAAVGLMLLTLVLQTGCRYLLRMESQIAAEAAALAAAQALWDDCRLLNHPAAIHHLVRQARTDAVGFAPRNWVGARPFRLVANDSNHWAGNVVVGTLAWPDRVFQVAKGADDPTEPRNLSINAVRVQVWDGKGPLTGGSLASLAAAATAYLDQDVIGFRPLGRAAAPIMPMALCSDATGRSPESWEHQVEQRHGPDRVRFRRHARGWVAEPGPDGLHEMTVRLALAAVEDRLTEPPNACWLWFERTDLANLGRQIRHGVTAADLAAYNSELVLPDEGSVRVACAWVGPAYDSEELSYLRECLFDLARDGTGRVWPLCRQEPSLSETVTLVGFVAARIAAVETTEDALVMTLQPCTLSSGCAVTDAARRQAGRIRPNPYVCRIRLVE
ncbi:MAG: hypothetical protein NZ700_04645 [Gemmataceae bacterium]|nr:hypothetical protein [Gemmataceae bacterium]MDW8264906.1 hypothetical protein [Gemmataceae bacterium]